MDSFISDFRNRVGAHLRAECPQLPVIGFLPDDIAHTPCVAVGRPRLTESGTSAVMAITLEVTVVGRRAADDDAQAELDAYADTVLDAMGGTRGVKVDDQSIRATDVEPGTVLVANLEYPAYLVTVAADVLSC